jgi:hypothetical protein
MARKTGSTSSTDNPAQPPTDNPTLSPTEKPTKAKDKFARDLLLDEVKYRRDKGWKIFASVISILLGVIAAVVAISSRPGFVNFATRQKVILVLTLLVLTIAAGFWLYRSLDKEAEIIEQLKSGKYGLEPLAGWSWLNFFTGYIPALFLIFVITVWAILWLGGSEPLPPLPPANTSWYFAVSGDSRDCGDLIMPKIAQAIADGNQKTPVDFYWHLGDLRAIYRVDCDMAKFKDPSFRCVSRDRSPDETQAMKNEYLSAAWPDYIANQIRPFEKAGIRFFLGIGNHELIEPKTQDEFRGEFREWLTQKALQDQRALDRAKGIDSKDGDTYFHFIKRGVDFIYLDNSDVYPKNEQDRQTKEMGFSTGQLNWLRQVLKADATNPLVKTIIVGMHEALPGSISSDHAMDSSCKALCNGQVAYDLLYGAQNEDKKHVYVLASHAHFFAENIYNTAAHNSQLLPGWIIGTAGAEQYQENILYGYMLVEVRPDGTVATSFISVDRNSPPAITAPWVDPLTRYCFEQNKKPPSTPTPTSSPTPPCLPCDTRP